MSVDRETKRALRAMADAELGGNLSALVTDLAEEARRRMAAGAYLRRHEMPLSSRDEAREIEKDLEREIADARKRARRGRRVA